jgi:arginyl-tRNA synthetase
MLMREKIRQVIKDAASQLGEVGDFSFDVSYPEAKFGDYATNAALVLSKVLGSKPQDVAQSLIEKMDKSMFESAEVAGPGFINFRLKNEVLAGPDGVLSRKFDYKILLEYFQPNIAKPLHIGHLETAIIGDAIKRMLLFAGEDVESDTHMGDWGTQFGLLILAYRKYGDPETVAKDPITELNKLYVRINQEIEADKALYETAKQEFVKLENHDPENTKVWKQFVEWSMEKFMTINDLMDILPFDHHWPESFYEDKMPAILKELEQKGILIVGEGGAKIVDLEQEKLGVAMIVKSDGGTTYLLRDLATFVFAKDQGYAKHLYVVDNRQSHHYKQMFAILKRMGVTENQPHSQHIEYGFISFKGEALSTRKGNMVLALDVVAQAEEKVAAIIEQKNPDLKDKQAVVKAVTKGALKYFILKHNRRSDIEFNWDEVLDFEGDSGPYLQYSYARLSSILRKANAQGSALSTQVLMTPTERELLFKLSVLPEIVEDSLKDYLPNVLASYLYNLSGLINKFYHESPVMIEKDEQIRNFRLGLITKAKQTLGQGLDLLGIKPLEEM